MRAIALALIATTIAAPVLAQPAPDRIADHMMTRFDTDHSGTISQAEWLAGGRKAQGFARMDTNHDGQLDRAELTAGIAARQARKAAKAAAAPTPTPGPSHS